MDAEYELEHSPLSSDVSRDGMTVKIYIYRGKDKGQGWSLEIVAEDGTSTVWDDLFGSDEEAFDEALIAIKKDGIASFLNVPSTPLN
jgi:hypothetical protein